MAIELIDWHTHILPEIDDGSRDVSESIKMLKSLAEQGVCTVVATPHFYPNQISLDDFLAKRTSSFNDLINALPEGLPKIICGAEVYYYYGISRLEGLNKLKIGDSTLLLLEMPMANWTEYTVKELIEIASRSKTTVVLAHVERYLKFQKRKTLQRLLNSGILMQTNASQFNGLISRRKALKSIKNGQIQFLGSDCHNLTSRPPEINKAYKSIEKCFGTEFLNKLNEHGKDLLKM